jgi:hypothetical protein
MSEQNRESTFMIDEGHEHGGGSGRCREMLAHLRIDNPGETGGQRAQPVDRRATVAQAFLDQPTQSNVVEHGRWFHGALLNEAKFSDPLHRRSTGGPAGC